MRTVHFQIEGEGSARLSASRGGIHYILYSDQGKEQNSPKSKVKILAGQKSSIDLYSVNHD